ncbi:MAG: hypothetical protein ACUVXD_10540 [Thermodesulfobacteriota bacterium]
MGFPDYRPRRMRRNENLRRMIRETSLAVDDLVYPLFVVHGRSVREEISSMPGQYRFSVDRLGQEARVIRQHGIPAVVLFGVPERKDPLGSEAYAEDGIVQRAVREIKAAVPELMVITDVCR